MRRIAYWTALWIVSGVGISCTDSPWGPDPLAGQNAMGKSEVLRPETAERTVLGERATTERIEAFRRSREQFMDSAFLWQRDGGQINDNGRSVEFEVHVDGMSVVGSFDGGRWRTEFANVPLGLTVGGSGEPRAFEVITQGGDMFWLDLETGRAGGGPCKVNEVLAVYAQICECMSKGDFERARKYIAESVSLVDEPDPQGSGALNVRIFKQRVESGRARVTSVGFCAGFVALDTSWASLLFDKSDGSWRLRVCRPSPGW